MLQLQDVPEGFWSANVLPYDPGLNAVLPIVEIPHMRNAYVGTGSIWAAINMRDILVRQA